MSKKQFNDLSDLKLVFSTNPEEAKNNFFEEEESNESKTPFSKQTLKVSLDKKHRSGKEVTLIEGLDMNDDELDDMARRLKSKCGIGGSVIDGLVLLQGDQRKKLPDVLAKMGFKKIKVIQ